MMGKILILCVVMAAGTVQGQTRVTEKVDVQGQSRVSLDIPFADEINLKSWDEDQVLVEADVEINGGLDDDIFRLESRTSRNTIHVKMDKDGWQEIFRNCWGNCLDSKIKLVVYYPKSMTVDAQTINGDYKLDYYGQPARLKTISGDIDLTVPDKRGVDFRARTISGEVYSDMDINYPNGTKGLNQFVGVNVKGRIYGGGPEMTMETISGDIFLRKGK